jgi:hypothetical protein
VQHIQGCFVADERRSHGDPIYSKKKARRSIRRGEEILSLKKVLQEDIPEVQKSLKAAQAEDNKDKSLAVFGEAEAVTIAMFDSLFSYMSGSKTCSKWSVVSKLMNKKKITCEAQENEFTKVDSEFQSEKTLKMEDVQILESCIQDFEDGLESLSKSLIKYRVSILNSFGH